MNISQKHLDIIDKINWIEYEQCRVAWCKAHLLLSKKRPKKDYEYESMTTYSSKGKEVVNDFINEYSEEKAVDLIKLYIEDTLPLYTPERFSDSSLNGNIWKRNSKELHLQMMDEIIKKSYESLEKEQKDAREELDEFLVNIGAGGIEAYENSSLEKKQEINFPEICEGFGLKKDGTVHQEFTAYDSLKKDLMEDLFDNDETLFFSNRELEEVRPLLDERKKLVVLFAMDREKIAMFWYQMY